VLINMNRTAIIFERVTSSSRHEIPHILVVDYPQDMP
jgi:hypothetical protein